MGAGWLATTRCLADRSWPTLRGRTFFIGRLQLSGARARALPFGRARLAAGRNGSRSRPPAVVVTGLVGGWSACVSPDTADRDGSDRGFPSTIRAPLGAIGALRTAWCVRCAHACTRACVHASSVEGGRCRYHRSAVCSGCMMPASNNKITNTRWSTIYLLAYPSTDLTHACQKPPRRQTLFN